MKHYPEINTNELSYLSSVDEREVLTTKKRESLKGLPKTYYSGVKTSVDAIKSTGQVPSFLQSFHSMSDINDDAAKRKDVIYLNVANPVTLDPASAEGSEDGSSEVYYAARNLGKAASQLTNSLTKKVTGFFSSGNSSKKRAGSADKDSDYSYLMIEDVVKEYARDFLDIDGDVSVRSGVGILDMYNVFMMKVALEAAEVAKYYRANSLPENKAQSLVFTPCFGYLYTLNGDVGIMPTVFETRIEDDWDITEGDVKRISSILSENRGIKTMVLNFPTNPTGKIMTEEMARNILRGIIASGRTDKIRIFSDEITGPLTLGGKENFSLAAISKLLQEKEFIDKKVNLEIYTAFSFSKVISADDRGAFVVQKRILHNCEPYFLDKDIEMFPKFSELSKKFQEKYKAVMKDFIAQKKGEAPNQYDLEAIRQKCRERIDHIKLCCEKLNQRIASIVAKSGHSLELDAEQGGGAPSHQDHQYVSPCLPKGQHYPESGNMLTLRFDGLGKLISRLSNVPVLGNADAQAQFLAKNAHCIMTSGGAFCSSDLLNNSVLRITLRGSNTIDMVFSRIGDCIEKAIAHGLNEDMTIKSELFPSPDMRRRSVQSLSSVGSKSQNGNSVCEMM